jgi:CBS domain-containing protein
MEERDCGCIPVLARIDDASLIGVITDRDIAVRGVARGRNGDTKGRRVDDALAILLQSGH